jgi:protocatechuate 3,4-dioxygenase beta subunit
MPRTPYAILGPYYRGHLTGYSDSPNNNFILPSRSFGTLDLHIAIVDATTQAPIHFATVEVWQADRNGIYDLSNPRPPDTPLEFWPNTSMYRGRFQPYGAGHNHILYTEIPGRYYQPPANGRPGFYREPHIHFRISKAGYVPLDTQVFFPRDPALPPSDDPYYVPQNTVWIHPTFTRYATFRFEL